ncbi:MULTISPECIES: hypothetical protein [unclassified Herbaspirillum]|uniref:hypothetical protein n=2 Tax=Herbaspirillum TaxID=963 RepID=UPI000E2E4F5D|nr:MULTISPECIES: hypothetical protein [unclassified Herbaspirillum]RFB68591.1 hypothetical protein DZB54_15725 [Herbaspirillum sp. 3R-3a1]TFI05498.1 hypothetical protein E4P32_20405 [Herbaspirillum sp. 3R11]TFI13592.1 hypothetical protein E4P31_18190 [Herbaspirillum sp. 3R-11]TFI27102.1 hypothetical protein E4P30_10480 [Herbaspirillum sp. 3C11]
MDLKTWRELAPEKKKFVIGIAVAVAVVYLICILLSVNVLRNNRVTAELNHQARMSSLGKEQGDSSSALAAAASNVPTVSVGTYVDGIDTFSIKDSSWSGTFYVWFRWTGEKSLDPGAKLVVVDGNIIKKEVLEEYHGDDGTHYQRLRVSAKFLKFFDTMRVPLEDHMLNIYLEDGARDSTKLRYVADTSSNVSSRVQISGYKITGKSNVVKPHAYRSSYGDPRVDAKSEKVFTQYIAGINIARSSAGVYNKIFLSLFAALALALCSFYVKASDVGPRFSLPSAAYFGAVANSYVANSILPPSGSFGLVDYVAAFGLATIALSLILALLSNFIMVKKEDKALSYALDRVMFWVLLSSCVLANIAIPWAARG